MEDSDDMEGELSQEGSIKGRQICVLHVQVHRKNIVAGKLADRCEVQLAYAIGVAEPVSLYVNTFGTNKIPESKIEDIVKRTLT